MNGSHEYYIGPCEATIKQWEYLGLVLHSYVVLYFCKAHVKIPKVLARTAQAIMTLK